MNISLECWGYYVVFYSDHYYWLSAFPLWLCPVAPTQHLPHRIAHKTNVSGPWSQMADFERNWAGIQNGLLAPARRRNQESNEPWGCHFGRRCTRATLANMSCPTSWRATGFLYRLWTGWCEGGRHVKVPAYKNQREEMASHGLQSPVDGVLTDRKRPNVSAPHPLRGEATSLGRCASSVSPISQVNQWLR